MAEARTQSAPTRMEATRPGPVAQRRRFCVSRRFLRGGTQPALDRVNKDRTSIPSAQIHHLERTTFQKGRFHQGVGLFAFRLEAMNLGVKCPAPMKQVDPWRKRGQTAANVFCSVPIQPIDADRNKMHISVNKSMGRSGGGENDHWTCTDQS